MILALDVAVAGDYVDTVRSIMRDAELFLYGAAVTAERARGTSWERIGAALRLTA
ncbi:hypothetical protein ACGFX4_38475 [Kitasatospora sp. NPDC048365]|uniref:hypothetical protein n=1 Tax=Kitasatospora sp. NPDC048365 TaxID=3364050 RepID=UPI00371F9C65